MDLKIEGLKVDGGEGSKGGKIIGHTSSGKPIYMDYRHKSHHQGKNRLTPEEHGEAAKMHNKIQNDLPEGGSLANIEKRQNHTESAGMHTIAKRTGYSGRD